MDKLFTLIMPVFNREVLISESLESIKRQTYRPLQLIVVDDGSTDNTAKVIKQWEMSLKPQDQISLNYIYQNNSGPSAARNRGIKEIKGEFVQFFDSDDLLHLDRLEKLVKVFNDIGADFIQTGFDSFDPVTKSIIGVNLGKPDEDQFELILKGEFWANTLRAALSKELVNSLDFWNEEMTCFEDREYMERAVMHAKNPVAIKEVLASARRGGSTRISDLLRTKEGRYWRIYCEEQIGLYVKQKLVINPIILNQFPARLLSLGLRSSANGWHELGARCLKLHDSLYSELSIKNKLKRFLLKHGYKLPQIQKLIVKKIFKLPK